MLPVKANFRNMHTNLQCDLCKDQNAVESQLHLLNCKVLQNHPQLKNEIDTIAYDDIFKDLSKQVRAARVWRKIWTVRNIELEK